MVAADIKQKSSIVRLKSTFKEVYSGSKNFKKIRLELKDLLKTSRTFKASEYLSVKKLFAFIDTS